MAAKKKASSGANIDRRKPSASRAAKSIAVEASNKVKARSERLNRESAGGSESTLNQTTTIHNAYVNKRGNVIIEATVPTPKSDIRRKVKYDLRIGKTATPAERAVGRSYLKQWSRFDVQERTRTPKGKK